jgi:pepF/M3 family oligoendopeptidase
MIETPPRWNLSNVYPGLDSAEYQLEITRLEKEIKDLEQLFTQRIESTHSATPIKELSDLVGNVIGRFNRAFILAGTLSSYIYSFVSTDANDSLAHRKESEFDLIHVRLQMLYTRFMAWLGGLKDQLENILASNSVATNHAFILRETVQQSQFLMSPAEESLAAELNLSGARAWEKLQETLCSQLSAQVEVEGKFQSLPFAAITNLRTHPDPLTRQHGYEAELAVLETMREPLAACMNGIKGTLNTLNQHRKRTDALHSSLDMARIDRPTLDVMHGAMVNSFPIFRRYFLVKARRLGKEKLAWFDLFAPTGTQTKPFTYHQAQAFILENFASFSVDLKNFAQTAFDQNWIDAEIREGKGTGAFCMDLDRVKESRVFCNFDGSLDQVSALAHELGHAYHSHCIYRAGKTPFQSITPMTLAETASILCETIIMQAVLKQVKGEQNELAILEALLINDSQTITDIYSRFLFEKEVFERRIQSELSADDFCEIIERVQKETYGEGLDERYLNRYMWAWKSHYYHPDLSFYNYPYAFGLLFGMGLYAIYQDRGEEFIPDYINLLSTTGEGNTADLAQRFGIDIRSNRFWEDSLAVIAKRVERYCEIQ